MSTYSPLAVREGLLRAAQWLETLHADPDREPAYRLAAAPGCDPLVAARAVVRHLRTWVRVPARVPGYAVLAGYVRRAGKAVAA